MEQSRVRVLRNSGERKTLAPSYLTPRYRGGTIDLGNWSFLLELNLHILCDPRILTSRNKV